MSFRVGGALALIAAVLLVVSIVTPAWWAGPPTVNGKEHISQDISIGLLGGDGCNTVGEGTCKRILLGGGFKTLSGIELGAAGASALLALALAATALLGRAARRKLSRLAIAAGALAALLAVALVAMGPDMLKAPAGTTVPLGYAALLGIVGGLTTIVGGLLGGRAAPVRAARAYVAGTHPAAPGAPPSNADVLAMIRDDGMVRPMDPVSPGGMLPGPAGPLTPLSGGQSPPLFAAAPHLRPLYEIQPVGVALRTMPGSGGLVNHGMPPQMQSTVPMLPPMAPQMPTQQMPSHMPPPMPMPPVLPGRPGAPMPPIPRSTLDADGAVPPPPPARPAARAPTPPPPARRPPPKRPGAKTGTTPPPFTDAPRAKPGAVTAPMPPPLGLPTPPGMPASQLLPTPIPQPSIFADDEDDDASETGIRPGDDDDEPSASATTLGHSREEEDRAHLADERARAETSDLGMASFGERTSPSLVPTTEDASSSTEDQTGATEDAGSTRDDTHNTREATSDPSASSEDVDTVALDRVSSPQVTITGQTDETEPVDRQSASVVASSPRPPALDGENTADDPPAPPPPPAKLPSMLPPIGARPLASIGVPSVIKPIAPPAPGAGGGAALPPPKQAATTPKGPSPACPQCDAPMAWVEEHLRFYCKSCKMYF